MKVKAVFICICIVFAFSVLPAQQLPRKFFKKANRFFKKYVQRGKIDYLYVKKHPESLNWLIAMISAAEIHVSSDFRQKAFYINAYNLLLIKSVVDDYPVLYPLEKNGLFSRKKFLVAKETLTLNDIETRLLREHNDIRIFFALNSASLGSLPLPNFAFKPGKINRQLKKIVKKAVNDYDYVRVMSRSSKILLVENLYRSKANFKSQEIIDLLNQFRKEEVPPGYTIDFYPANRRLNRED